MSIYITGDLHGVTNAHRLAVLDTITTENDYLIIVGDFGIPSFKDMIGDSEGIRVFNKKHYTTLFIDGNHENFFEINSLPIKDWHGGKVHKINHKIIHLMRGQVFNIEGKTFFTFGGAISVDKLIRIPGFTYFPEEDCNTQETNEAMKNIDKLKGSGVDYVITHTCSTEYLKKHNDDIIYGQTVLEQYTGNVGKMLDYVEENLAYKHWYFGHFHRDCKIDAKHTLLSENILELETNKFI